MNNESITVALDIGTTRIRAIIGEPCENGLLEISGVGTSPSRGMRGGVVVNIESTLRSVVEAIEAAELMSGRTVKSCWTSIGGTSIEGRISKGVVAVNVNKQREAREISAYDMERVMEAARAVNFPMDREVLDVIPQSYKVDDQGGIRNPIDMIGVRLESEVHIITCPKTSVQNLVRCVNRAGFHVDGLVLQPLAAGTAVLTEEEKDLGVAVIDLGGGTTNALVYGNGAPFATFSVPVGGQQVTNDISIVKSVSFETAEKIKIEAGCCWAPLLEGQDAEIIVPGMGGRAPFSIRRSSLLQIIEPRVKETFVLVKEKLDKISATRPLGGGIVLTGGGAMLQGAADLAAQVFKLPVRIGDPLPLGGLADDYCSPEFATALGLAVEADMRSRRGAVSGEAKGHDARRPAGFISRLANWVKTEFF
ncbi:MAG: cell division protein FtsA [Spirochaetaceae bacterium]|nr:cell division protein FtsA [Spirochaetaceae bacterium]